MFLTSVEDFATMARARRVELGLTQVELAEAIGRSQTWVSGFESGRTVPLLDSVLLVARSLGLGLICTDDPWGDVS